MAVATTTMLTTFASPTATTTDRRIVTTTTVFAFPEQKFARVYGSDIIERAFFVHCLLHYGAKPSNHSAFLGVV